MNAASSDERPIAAMLPGFPVDDFALVIGLCIEKVSIHIFRTPQLADGSHLFHYEHIRCYPNQVFATGATVFVRDKDGERIFHLGADLGPCQIDMSSDVSYEDRDDLVSFISEHLADLKEDTARKGIPRLVLREGNRPEELVDPRTLVIHGDGLFRIGHGWLMRWDEIADVTAPMSEGAAADLRIYATDGRLVGIRIDLL